MKFISQRNQTLPFTSDSSMSITTSGRRVKFLAEHRNDAVEVTLTLSDVREADVCITGSRKQLRDGICGNADGISGNDWVLRHKKIKVLKDSLENADLIVESWRDTTMSCPSVENPPLCQKIDPYCRSLLDSEDFEACRRRPNSGVYDYYRSCAIDICHGSPSFSRFTACEIIHEVLVNVCGLKEDILGKYCAVGPCTSNTCVNGRCEPIGSHHHVCVCNRGFAGESCSIPRKKFTIAPLII